MDYKDRKVDLSRLDAMVALRMRITGHSRNEIESTLRTVAAVVHSQEPARDWDHYAKRNVCDNVSTLATLANGDRPNTLDWRDSGA